MIIMKRISNTNVGEVIFLVKTSKNRAFGVYLKKIILKLFLKKQMQLEIFYLTYSYINYDFGFNLRQHSTWDSK